MRLCWFWLCIDRFVIVKLIRVVVLSVIIEVLMRCGDKFVRLSGFVSLKVRN